MASRALDTTPFWTRQTPVPAFSPIRRDMAVDAVVIGGGITGVTAAYLLKDAGLTVALVERDRCGQGETGHTTAHLSAITDRPLGEMARSLGADRARAVWNAGFAAVSEIDTIVRRERISCDFQWCPAYLHASLDGGHRDQPDEIARLRTEAALVTEAGFDAAYVDTVPGLGRPGVRFEHQAQFHPMKYLYTLLARLRGDWSYVFEHSPVDQIRADPLAVIVGQATISTKYVVIATHVPLTGAGGLVQSAWLQTDLYPCSTYAIRATIPKGRLPEALFWDLSEPYYYLRVDAHATQDNAIFGGADHKAGQAGDPREHFAHVERQLQAILPEARVTHRWSGEVIETGDGLPYIGVTAPGQFTITGLSGNGLTFGTVGAMMARDAAVGRTNPWIKLFDINRARVAKGLWAHLIESHEPAGKR